jgi:hypothetical protein
MRRRSRRSDPRRHARRGTSARSARRIRPGTGNARCDVARPRLGRPPSLQAGWPTDRPGAGVTFPATPGRAVDAPPRIPMREVTTSCLPTAHQAGSPTTPSRAPQRSGSTRGGTAPRIGSCERDGGPTVARPAAGTNARPPPGTGDRRPPGFWDRLRGAAMTSPTARAHGVWRACRRTPPTRRTGPDAAVACGGGCSPSC